MGHDPAAARAGLRHETGGRARPLMQVRERPAPLVTRAYARGTPGYPSALEDLRDPPRQLYVRGGELPPAAVCVAIVGARAATSYGSAIAERLARDLASHGIATVSGLARGIDAAAHTGALAGGGRTIAVLASAVSDVTPSAHGALAARVAASGAVVSEVAEGGPFGRGAFVKRNRIIAALSAVTVVVEASETSGSLSTAAAAIALGRPLLAVPADVDRPGFLGTLALLRGGARVCSDAGDVLAALGPRAVEPIDASDPDQRLRACLSRQATTVEHLAATANLAPADALARLLRFQWSGLAVSHPGGRWSARV